MNTVIDQRPVRLPMSIACGALGLNRSVYGRRKHHASRFGLLKNKKSKCADDSLSRAFTSNEDSIHKLFSPEGNRTLRDHPNYGRPIFAVVWYEDWAILCTSQEAVLIQSDHICNYSRKEDGAHERIREIQRLWETSEQSLKLPLNQVNENIA
ncbi:MAG: hypothetical protein L3J28_10320 [Candidatus Polarisedimenticolaceae bacterium]|nr:hypothetical protein [Candidatus Polarisedimenticolaceae bacterium]